MVSSRFPPSYVNALCGIYSSGAPDDRYALAFYFLSGSAAPQAEPQAEGAGSAAPQAEGAGSAAPQAEGAGSAAPQAEAGASLGSAEPQAEPSAANIATLFSISLIVFSSFMFVQVFLLLSV